MKYKTTAKELKDGYYHIISCGYCELQSLFIVLIFTPFWIIILNEVLK
jgi:hypothetical protein